MTDRCVDCDCRPRLHEAVSCYSETFPMKAPDGAQYHLTLRLCLACGTRFAGRAELREYLRTKLPAPVKIVAEAVAV